MATFNFRGLWHLTFALVLLSLVVSSLATVPSAPPAAGSPSADGGLICHTDNPSECYPKVFSPTEEFQPVHDDQDLPPGLHVRMNIWSGQKEARLNTPMPGDDAALQGLPVDQAVVVVEPELAKDEPQIPAGAPAYEPVGLVKEPQHKNPSFFTALETLKEHGEMGSWSEDHPLNGALQDLEDDAHDMYYGRQITGDDEALRVLFCLATKRDAEEVKTVPYPSRQDYWASAILASALQNNPPALRDVEKAWDTLMAKECGTRALPLKDVLFSQVRPVAEPGSVESAYEATWMRATLAVLGRLLKSDKIRAEFVEKKGMEDLLRILATEGPEWEAARAKVGRHVVDNFLDASVGAKGDWRPQVKTAEWKCETAGKEFDDTCWEFYVDRILRKTPEAAWAEELLSMLRHEEPGGPSAHEEL